MMGLVAEFARQPYDPTWRVRKGRSGAAAPIGLRFCLRLPRGGRGMKQVFRLIDIRSGMIGDDLCRAPVPVHDVPNEPKRV